MLTERKLKNDYNFLLRNMGCFGRKIKKFTARKGSPFWKRLICFSEVVESVEPVTVTVASPSEGKATSRPVSRTSRPVSPTIRPVSPLSNGHPVNNGHPLAQCIIRGTKCQSSLRSKYSNNQCTSIAFQALAEHVYRGSPESWTGGDIDAILDTGNRLHTALRDKLKISEAGDKRVGLHDIPNHLCISSSCGRTCVVNVSANGEPRDGPFTYLTKEAEIDCGEIAPAFTKTMKEWLEDSPLKSGHALVTIGCFSMAVWKNEGDDRIWLFDSHGRDEFGLNKFRGSSGKPTALCRSFSSLLELYGHLIALYGYDFQYSARSFNFAPGTYKGDTPAEIGGPVQMKAKNGGPIKMTSSTTCTDIVLEDIEMEGETLAQESSTSGDEKANPTSTTVDEKDTPEASPVDDEKGKEEEIQK